MIYVFASKFLLQKGLENLNFQKFQTQNHSYSTIDSKVVYLILGKATILQKSVQKSSWNRDKIRR